MKKISFFYPTGKKIGLGHQRRCQAIADYLTKNKLTRVQFNKITINTSVAIFDFPSQQNVSKQITNYKLQITNLQTILIENISLARFQADINIYPVAHFSPTTLDWKGYEGKIYSGAKYFPLNQEFLKPGDKKLTLHSYNHKSKKSILITFGASDFRNLTPKIIKTLLSIPNIEIHAVIGPFFKKQSFNWPSNVFIHQNNPNIASLMAKATLAITAFGTTCYELAYLGIPALIIYNFKRDKQDALNFQNLDSSQVLGYYQNVSPSIIRDSVKKLLSVPQRLKRISIAGKKLVDAKGAARIANIIKILNR